MRAKLEIVLDDKTKDALVEAISRFTEENASSPELARACLVASGIYQKDGQLAEPYRSGADTGPDAQGR